MDEVPSLFAGFPWLALYSYVSVFGRYLESVAEAQRDCPGDIMYSYRTRVGYTSAEPVRKSLAEGTPLFGLWRRADLSERWTRVPLTFGLAVEVPDTPWGRAYYYWAISELDQQGPVPEAGSEVLGVMLTSTSEFRAPGDARAESARCLRALLEIGKPPREHIVQLVDVQ